MSGEPLDDGICEELYGVWRVMYRNSGDRAGAHLRWLGADPERLEEVAAYVEDRPVDTVPGLDKKTAAYCQRADVEMLRHFADEIREERGEVVEDPW
jgi:hypothetical protein